jgi:uncharacterized protein (TIRG00374 family)
VTRLLRSPWTRLILSAAILWWLSTRIDMAGAWRALVTVHLGYLALVLVLVGIDRLVMIYRWVLLLRASGVSIPIRKAADIFLVSSFVGSFLPAGVGGDAARAVSLRNQTVEGGEALASVVVDRLLGMLSLAAMGAVGLLAWAPGAGTVWRAIAAVVVLGSLCVATFWGDRIARFVVPDRHHAGPVGRRLLRLTDAVSRYRGRGGTLAQVMAWSILVQFLRITQAWLLGLGLGLTVPFAYYMLFMPLGLLMLLLPISVSGFGLPQGVIVWLLRPMGVADEASFALSTLIVLTGLAGNLPGLLLWLRRDREIL